MAGEPSDSDRPAGHHVELETKFDVLPGAGAPSFDGLPWVARVETLPPESLEAVYYDTPGHDLALNRITLRRRTGGRDAGWHLKLPGGAASGDDPTRTEIHAPLDTTELADGTGVPEALVDIVRAIVRDRPLVPVAHINTIRTVQMLYGADGAELAEYADDEVTAWRVNPVDGSAVAEQRWREWELEMAEASVAAFPGESAADLLDRIGSRLRAAGAVPAGHGSKLAKILGTPPPPPPPADPVHAAVLAEIGELLKWDRATRADAYDSVHQMRVTTRKIRSLLQASEDEFGITDDAWILGELRELAGILGVARDAEVLAERYERALAALPADLVRGPVRERLVGGSQRTYRLGHRRSLAAMRSQRYFRLLDALDALAHEPPPEPKPQEHAPIDVAYRRLRKAARAAAAAATAATADLDHALHRLRKRSKRLRYIAAATNRPEAAEPAKTIQSLLGDHQDSVVSRAHLSRVALQAHAAGEDTFTYGLLFQQEDDLARRSREQLDDALAALKAGMKGRDRRDRERGGRAGL